MRFIFNFFMKYVFTQHFCYRQDEMQDHFYQGKAALNSVFLLLIWLPNQGKIYQSTGLLTPYLRWRYGDMFFSFGKVKRKQPCGGFELGLSIPFQKPLL